MGYDDNTLIYIEENDKIEASIAAKGFADEEVKNRAYINSLGAELALKYLTSENINVSNIYNIHSIKKVLEATDISDIMLPNIHIDVRVIFDDNFIFIPKSHFEYNLVPDIYLIFNLAKDFTHVKFLGFFEPKLINKNNANDKYFFIEKEKLNPPIDLKSYIENYKGNTIQSLPDSEMENFESIMISMADNDISEDDKKYLLQQLTKSAELRDKFIEYENFELLSYTAVNDNEIEKREIKDDLAAAISTDEFSDIADISELNDLTDITEKEPETTEQISLEDLPSEDEILSSDNTDFITSDLEDIPEIDDILADNTAFESNIPDEIETSNEIKEDKDVSNLLGDAAVLGTAAILGAGAGASAVLGEEAVTGLTDGIEIAKDSLDIIYEGLDFASDAVKNQELETNSLKNEAIDLTKEFIEESDNSMDLVNDLPDLAMDEDMPFEQDIEEPIAFEEIEPSKFEENETPQEEIAAEIISLDEVDTSNLEEIEIPEEDVSAETISINNIDTTDVENQEVDYINEIDNKISFDKIDIQNTELLETPDLKVSDTIETMSLNDIDTSSMDNISIDEDLIENEKLSFDDVDTSHLHAPEIEVDDDKIDNTMSFDNIDIEDNDTVEAVEENEVIDNDFLDDSMSFDDNDFEKIELLDETDYTNTDAEPINEEPLESMEEIEKEKNESFGKNLLDGLSSENLSSDISIESIETEFDLPETDNLPNAEDISSNDLLAEIDDILSTTQANEKPQIPENEVPETPIEDVLGINSLDEIIPEAQEPFETENTDEDIVSLIDNVETNYISDEPQYDEISSINEPDNNDEKLGVLFDDNDSDNDDEEDAIASLASFELDAMQENPESFASVPGVALYKKQSGSIPQNKKTIIVAAALVAVLASVSVLALLKSKGGDASVENLPPTTGETEQTAENTNTPLMPTEEVTAKPVGDQNNVLTNAPDINTIDKKEVLKAKSSNELKSAAKAPKTKPISSESYLSVQKLVWDVPDYLSYSSKMKNYLMTAGKSIKLSLSADLLLATEYAYSNQVKVNLKLGNDGSVQDAKVVTSSGSEQIDKIVLQSVKDTLNVVKPPSGEVKGPNFNLSLIIYF